MRVVRQKDSLTIKNHDDCVKSAAPRRHGPLLPSTIRCIITGPSNCGKTNIIISLIEQANGLRFENVYVYSKSLYQPKYEYLSNLLKSIPGLGYYAYSDGSEILPPDQAKQNSIFIFDDIACDKQDIIREYFSMGRHKNVDCFYLCQTYACIPKHLIRDNANLLVVFKQDDMNLQKVYRDHVTTDMSYEQFKNICAACWNVNKFGFLVIDKDSDLNNGRYRKGFDSHIYL